VTLRCTGLQTCSGTLELSAQEPAAPGAGLQARAAAAGAHSAAGAHAPQTIGEAAYAIAPGSSAAVELALTAHGRALLSHARAPLSVTLTVHGAAAPVWTHAKNLHLELVRRPHGPGRLERSAVSQSGGTAAVSVGAG
jgi:hypothetical protein